MNDQIISAMFITGIIVITIGSAIGLIKATAKKNVPMCALLIILIGLFAMPLSLFAILYVIIKWPRESKQRKNYEAQISQLQAENEELKRQIAGQARPGSDAHYAAWREEQRKKNESRE